MDLRKSLAFLAVMTLSLNTVSQIPVQLDERAVTVFIIALSYCDSRSEGSVHVYLLLYLSIDNFISTQDSENHISIFFER